MVRSIDAFVIFPPRSRPQPVSLGRLGRLVGWSALILLLAAGNLAATNDSPPKTPASIAQFEEWWQEYFVAPEKARSDLAKKGAELVQQRREDMVDLIKDDPELALRLAFPEEYHDALPKLIAPSVEVHVRGMARLKVIGSDPKDKRSLLSLDKQTWPASFYGRRLQLTSRTELPIHGIVLGGRIAVQESPLERFPARESLLTALRQSEGKKTCPICGEPGTIPGAVGDLLMWFDSEEHLEMCEKAIIEKEMQPEVSGDQ